MILILAVLFSIAVGLLLGGKLTRLAGLPFKHGWLAFVAVALQVIAVYVQGTRGPAILFMLSYAVLILLVLINIRLAGVPLIGLGLGLNALVIAANGGYMPVTPEAVSRAGLEHLVHDLEAGSRVLGAKDMLLPRVETNLWVLSDIFVLRGPMPTVFSIGDCVLVLGILVFFLCAMSPEIVQSLGSHSAESV